MQTTGPTPYGIPEVEIPYVIKWLGYQSRTGSRMPINDDSVFSYFGAFQSIVRCVNRIDNPVFEALITKLIETAIGGTDNLKAWTKMKVTADYYHYLKAMSAAPAAAPAGSVPIPYEQYDFPWKSYYNMFCGGYGYKTPQNVIVRNDNGYNKPYNDPDPINLNVPETSPGNKKISDYWGLYYLGESTQFANNPPANYVSWGTDITRKTEVTAAEKSLFDTLNATAQFPLKYMQPVEVVQLQKVKDLLAKQNLPADGYFMLFLLTIGLNTAGTADRALAKKIVSASCSSDCYPNDIFINQLLYLSLMLMVDPNGPYKWGKDKMLKVLNALLDMNKQTDDVSVAIKLAIEKQVTALNATPSYPSTDPQCSDPFNVRMTNAMAALEIAKKTIKP